MLVEASGGAVPRVHVKGDREHPLSRGYLCPKGKASADMTFSPKRLLYPLRRDGARGSGRWRRVTWDEALDDIAARLNAIIAAHGARAVAVQSLPPKDYFAYDLFLDAIGSPTFFKHDSHQCFTPQLIADVLTYGNLLTYPAFTELKGTDLLVLWGINLAETNASKHQRVRDARRAGCRTIVVDPRPTQAAREASLWLRVRPGTDAALALGILNAMIANGWYDREFVAQWTLGFEALAERAARYSPERVESITWVPARDIVEAARLLGAAQRPALYTFIGATMGGNSIATMRAMGFIPALAGQIDRQGANGFLPPTGVRMPSYYGADPSLGRSRNLDEMLSADKFPLLAGPQALTAPYPHPRQVIDAMLTGKPYPVRALWTSCNPMVGLEDTCTTLRALSALDLLVVSELFETPTARLADYVLPMTTHLESNAIAEYSGLNMICARVRALEPRGEAREEGWAVLEVAKRMGYGERLPVQTYEELLD
jgi:anaerobic selenocysteine-containing dehydrogenase